MVGILETVNRVVWGLPALLSVIGVGLILTVRTRFAQLRFFPAAVRKFIKQLTQKEDTQNGISAYQALCTALAATVGTGNLAGVAGAIAIGGPGAVFWMWICGLLGMVTKFAEATLAVRYRTKSRNGQLMGGPMYMIEAGMGRRRRWLGYVYSFLGVIAAFGVGNATQINAVIGGINSAAEAFGLKCSDKGNLLIGIGLSVLICMMLLGGAKRIGQAAEKLVPFASVMYILLGMGVLVMKCDRIVPALISIVKGAFVPKAVTGGMIGSFFLALRVGASRGVFSNEAGMGTASIAHGCAQVRHPVEQGLMGIIEVFIDTIVICTMTALVILCSGTPIHYRWDTGVVLTADAFSSVYGQWIKLPIAAALICFAFATVLGWGLYGVRCAQYLFGENVWKWFVLLQGITVVLGSVLKTGTVWLLSETVNGMMLIPNLILLAYLTPELCRLTNDYNNDLRNHRRS